MFKYILSALLVFGVSTVSFADDHGDHDAATMDSTEGMDDTTMGEDTAEEKPAPKKAMKADKKAAKKAAKKEKTKKKMD